MFSYCLECVAVCLTLYEPVCGSNGITYSNKCHFKTAQCKSSSIKVAYNGKCKPSLTTGKYIFLLHQLVPEVCDVQCIVEYSLMCTYIHWLLGEYVYRVYSIT